MGFLDALQYVGESLDKPGRAVRGVLAGRAREAMNFVPFSDALGLTDPKDAVSGRDLLEKYGALDANQEGLDAGDVAGFLAEMALDPTNLIGAGLIKKGVSAAGRVKAANELSKKMRAMGAMPEEIVAKLHPSMLDEAGKPRKMYHGTPKSGLEARDLDPAFAGTTTDTGFYGKGVNFTPEVETSQRYTLKGRRGPQTSSGATIQAFVDARNPFHAKGDVLEELARQRRAGTLDPGALTDALKEKGHDAVIMGREAIPEEVLAFDKSQIYLPYIAKALEKEPSVKKRAALLALYNAAARQRGGE